MTWARLLYLAIVEAARLAAPLAGRRTPHNGAGLATRAASPSAFAAWAAARRDRARPLLLVHAASAGELRQAEPVLQRVKRRYPDWQLAATCFSPSGSAVADSLPVDVSGLLPWDAPRPMAAFLDALAPAVIVVCKHDLWPTFALSARARGIRLGMIAATVRAGSGRLWWPARQALAPAYRALEAISAVSEADAARLVLLGADPGSIRVDGDPRYDAVLERRGAWEAPPRDPDLLVAGSTWPADERTLLTAFRTVRSSRPSARLVIAPHQPSPPALDRVRQLARQLGLPPPGTCSTVPGDDPVQLLEEVGPLARLYGAAGIAYVGGGFGKAGLHSVLEPAAWGIPVIVGPGDGEHPDARALSKRGALARLPASDGAAALARRWLDWLANPLARETAGAAALATVQEGAGAAERAAALVTSMMAKHGGPARGRPG